MDALLAGVLMMERPGAGDDAAKQSTDRLAVMAVRRTALRHRCAGPRCLHRNHRRDRMHARFLAEMLLLPDAVARPSDYESDVHWDSFTHGDEVYFR